MVSSDFAYSPHGEDWLYDEYATGAGLSFQITNTLAAVHSPYQNIKIVASKTFGKTLLLNNWIYRTEDSGTAMPEMIVHVPMNTGSTKRKRILLIGGGDGFSAAEILKYPEVEHLDILDIDEKVVELCKKHFKTANKAFSDQRITVHIKDGAQYIERYTGKPYDVILVTGTEVYDAKGNPGISHSLFQPSFYKNCLRHLTPDGLFLTDGQNGYYGGQQYLQITKVLRTHFPVVKNYSVTAKYIPGGLYIITISSRHFDPEIDVRASAVTGLRYYNTAMHKASFVLPQFILDEPKK